MQVSGSSAFGFTCQTWKLRPLILLSVVTPEFGNLKQTTHASLFDYSFVQEGQLKMASENCNCCSLLE